MGKNSKLFSLILIFVLICYINVFAAPATVNTDNLNVRAAADTNSEIVGKLQKGTVIDVTGMVGNWYSFIYNGQTRYVFAQYVSPNQIGTCVVSTDVLNVRKEPNVNSEKLGQVTKGTFLSVMSVNGEWFGVYYNSQTAYVHSSYVTYKKGDVTISRGDYDRDLATRIVEYSKQFIGTPYVSGGASPGGFDCSGFTYYVYKQFGITLGRSSAEQAAQGVFVERENILPGDLLFYSYYGNGAISHVGIYIGDGKMIHATVPGKTLAISDINGSYYKNNYVTARRVIK